MVPNSNLVECGDFLWLKRGNFWKAQKKHSVQHGDKHIKSMNPCTLKYSTDELIAPLGGAQIEFSLKLVFPCKFKNTDGKELPASSISVCLCVYLGYKSRLKARKKSSKVICDTKMEPLKLVHHIMGLYQGTIMNVKCLLETGGGKKKKIKKIWVWPF